MSVLKQSCDGCGSSAELYHTTCKHHTVCFPCGKSMAETGAKCSECDTPVTRLIREYNIRACPNSDKNYFIGRFGTGLPTFKKQNENKWSLQKEGLQGRQITYTLREKYKNRPWLLEDETGQAQYHGQLDGSQAAKYYLLMLQGKEFVAIPASSWYNFNKVAQYKQLTLEEAEEKMKNRRKAADGYQRWMMKAANNGAAAFGELEKDDHETAAGGGRGRKKSTGDDEKGDELGLGKKSEDDYEEGPRGGDLDFDDNDIEKGDDWEHEEIFTDDDEAVGNNPEEREDLAPEIPAPPEIKQDDEDEDEAEDEEGGLSKSGKELKKLLGRSNGLNDSDAEEEDDEDSEDISPVLAPKKEAAKEEPVEISPQKATSSTISRGTPPNSKSSKGKRKLTGEELKASDGTTLKKVKTENEVKTVKDEPTTSVLESGAPPKGASSKPGSTPPTGPVTEDEIRAALVEMEPVTIQDFSSKFKSRVQCKEDKAAFMDMVRKMATLRKTDGASYVVLRKT